MLVQHVDIRDAAADRPLEALALAGHRQWRCVCVTNSANGEECNATECFKEAVVIDLEDESLCLHDGNELVDFDRAFGQFVPLDIGVKVLGTAVSKADALLSIG